MLAHWPVSLKEARLKHSMYRRSPSSKSKSESLACTSAGSLSERIVLFTRYPQPGRVKTRLIGALGPEGAAELHREMTERMLAELMKLKSQRSLTVEVVYEGGSPTLMKKWLRVEVPIRPQGKGDLGARIGRAFERAFDSGMSRVVVVGSDCPMLNSTLIEQALDSLECSDLVIGPATDGGYYLIGLRRHTPRLFVDIPWGTSDVFARSVAVASSIGLQLVLLEPLTDVDRPEDLRILKNKPNL